MNTGNNIKNTNTGNNIKNNMNTGNNINDNNDNCKTDSNVTEKETQSIMGNNDKKEKDTQSIMGNNDKKEKDTQSIMGNNDKKEKETQSIMGNNDKKEKNTQSIMGNNDKKEKVSGNNDKKEDNTLRPKTLPKRVKFKPNLKTRTNVSSTISHDQEELENNILENKNIDVNKSRSSMEIKNLDDSNFIETSALPEEILTNDNSHNSEMGNDNSHNSETGNDNSHNSEMGNDNSHNSETGNDNSQNSETGNDNSQNSETGNDNSLEMQITSENKLGRCDDDYDSFSEGEMVGRQLISKNKVFKPNLGAKRRERLSSFTAYSSCDEDDSQNLNKRKKENAKHSVKQKNRENLEPNMKKLRKKQKRLPKTDTYKQSKHQEEREISSLTMQELIHYNHPSFKTVELRSKRDADENEHVIDVGDIAPTVPCESKPETKHSTEEDVIAPQIMINEDGEIVINQESLTINQKVDDSSLKKNVVYEDSLSYGTHLKRKHVVGKRWNIEETLRFYKALSEIGTDFTLMSQAFGRFSRNELKKKFKKEEKVNCDLVDRALSNRLPLNMEMFLRGKEEMKDKIEENQDGD